MVDLFGRYCYIDTPWIAGEKTRYRIIGSGVRSNSWCEVPVTGRTELIHHDNTEEIVFVVLDTLVRDDSIIQRFALKDVDVLDEATEKVENLADALDGFPAQVTFMTLKNCTINVFPSQAKVFEAKNKDD